MKATVAFHERPTSARAARLAAVERSVKRRARRRSLLLCLPLLLAPVVYFSVRALSRSERALARSEVHQSRIVTYAVEPGRRLHFSIEPNTDVLRIVAHAFSHAALAPAPHTARLVLEMHGATRVRTEPLELSLPGVAQRAIAEDSDMTVGDPSPINIDVHDFGGGELTLELETVTSADGLLLRAYRREAVSGSDTLQRRRASLSEAKRERLARRAGEVDFDDLAPSDRAVLVGARWRKLAALPDADEPVTFHALALAQPQAVASESTRGGLGDFELRGDERIAGVVHGPNTISARARRSDGSRLVLVLHSAEHGELTIEGSGSVSAKVGANEQAEFEIGSSQDERVALDVSDESGVTLGHPVRYVRSVPERPVFVDTDADPIVLQLHARRPVARTLATAVDVAVLAVISTKASGELMSRTLVATLARSRVDRYADAANELAPSDPFVFRVLVPPHARLALRPETGAIDIALSELDPRAPPRPIVSRSEPAGVAASWNGFVPRLPSNAADFAADNTGLVRVVQRAAARSAGSQPTKLAVLHVERPRAATALRRGGRWFVRADTPLSVRVSGSAPLALPIRLYAEHGDGTKLLVEIDDGQPRRRVAALAQRITTSRSVTLHGETPAVIVLGDDLAEGQHRLAFTTESGTAVWVHLPWARQATPRRREPHWISGDFDP